MDCQHLGVLWMIMMKAQSQVLSFLFMQNTNIAVPGFCAVFRSVEPNRFLLYTGRLYVDKVFIMNTESDTILGELHEDQNERSTLNLYNTTWYKYTNSLPIDHIAFLSARMLGDETLSSHEMFENALGSHLYFPVDSGSLGVVQTSFSVEYMRGVLLPDYRNETDYFGRRLILSDDGLVLLSTHTPLRVNGTRPLVHWNQSTIVTREGIQFLLNNFKVMTIRELCALTPINTVHHLVFKVEGEYYMISFTIMTSPFADYELPSYMIVSIMQRTSLLGLTVYAPLFAAMIVLLVLIGVIFISVTFALCLAVPIEMVSKEMFSLSRLKFRQPSISTAGGIFTKMQTFEVRRMVTTLNQMKSYLRRFKLFLPKHIVRLLVRESQMIPFQKKHLTVSFSDIEKFTTISNVLPADKLARLMSEFYILATGCVHQNGGWVIEILGDALFVAYGIEGEAHECESDECVSAHACAASKTCLEINDILSMKNTLWVEQGLSPIRMRHGISTGDAWCGCIGNNWRMQYIVSGAPVEMSHQLEQFGKRVCNPENSILVDENTVKFLHLKKELICRWVGPKTDQLPKMQVFQVCGERGILSEEQAVMYEHLRDDCSLLHELWMRKSLDAIVTECKYFTEKWRGFGNLWKSFEYCIHEAERLQDLQEQAAL
mmetsp:Transcript_8340/g.30808  ORF Transcript_8340/g.30808 Transcript_8340/m.30808 type:complete len:658 (-) Transcript_8340:249-2222(-)